MKHTISLLTMLFTITSMVSAQSVKTMEKTMSFGKQPGVYVEVEGGEKDRIKDIWEDYMKDFGKTKRNKKANEYYSEDAKIPVLSTSGNVHIYATFEDGKDRAIAYMWAVADGSFLEDSKGLNTFAEDYYIIARKDVINEEIKDQEETMKNLDKELGKLVKKNDGYHKDIAKAEDKIREAEENIEKNLNDQDEMKTEIEKQKEVLDMIVKKLNDVR